MPEERAERRAHVAPRHDEIDHSVLEEEFCPLKALWETLANGRLDDTGAREADQGRAHVSAGPLPSAGASPGRTTSIRCTSAVSTHSPLIR